MHSPLPDASALEAGILEDETPSRLSRVQDNVRHLLRTSVFNSVHSSPQASPTRQHQPTGQPNGLPTPPESPIRRASQHPPETMPSPHAEILPTPSTTASSPPATPQIPQATHVPEPIPGVLFPPASYRQRIQHMAHQSTLFNTRAVAALNHPDLSDASLATYLQSKAESRQRHAWKRSRHGRRHHGKRNVAARAGSSQCLLCVLAALLLAAVVATYLVLATTSTNTTPTFHILFILGILLATIVFAHTLVRLCLFSESSRSGKRKVFVVPVEPRPKHQHHHHHRRHRGHEARQDSPLPRAMPAFSDDNADFVPATPIPVHMPIDEVRPDSRDALPTATAEVESPSQWDKDIPDTVPNPPPAYGRWRGSVRANPDLLHWQVVPSSVDADAPVELPSPTYEEATKAAQQTETGPPSYVTRDSPARRREVQEGERALSQAVEPEMVEVRGMGLAV